MKTRSWRIGHVALLAVAGCGPSGGAKLATQSVGASLPMCPAPTQAGTVLRDQPYGPAPLQVLDVYLPASAPAPMPVFVWIHGGGWRNGDHKGIPQELVALTEKGMAVISTTYRRSDTPYPTTISDVREAIRWIHHNAAQYGFDPNHIGVAGSSAGGHLVSMLGAAAEGSVFDLVPSPIVPRVHLVVDIFGPSHLLQMDADATANGCPTVGNGHEGPNSPETDLIDCANGLSSCVARAREASPVFWASSDDPPFLVFHGEDDCVVAPRQGQRMYDALIAAGAEASLRFVPNADHNRRAVTTSEVWDEIYAAIDTHLRGCEPTGGSELNACMHDNCANHAATCEADPICLQIESCVQGCFGTQGCIAGCIQGQPSPSVNAHRALYQCGNPAGCYDEPEPEPVLDPCLTDHCEAQAAACEADPICLELEDCIRACFGTQGCIASCTQGQPSGSVNTHRSLFQCGRNASCY